jgi:hypothetical protein
VFAARHSRRKRSLLTFTVMQGMQLAQRSQQAVEGQELGGERVRLHASSQTFWQGAAAPTALAAVKRYLLAAAAEEILRQRRAGVWAVGHAIEIEVQVRVERGQTAELQQRVQRSLLMLKAWRRQLQNSAAQHSKVHTASYGVGW